MPRVPQDCHCGCQITEPYNQAWPLAGLPIACLQIKQEAELRGHTEGVTNLAWHPVHPDKLASIAGQEKSVR